MNTNERWHALLVAVSLLASPVVSAWTDPKTRAGQPDSASASPSPGGVADEVRTLSEVKKVDLQIRGTNSREWSRYGFTDAELRSAITEQMRRAGIEVVPPIDSALDRETYIFEVDVHVNDQTVNNSYIVFLRLKGRLPLPHDPQSYVTKTVWSDWKIGGFEPYNYRKLRAEILSMVQEFLSQYGLQR